MELFIWVIFGFFVTLSIINYIVDEKKRSLNIKIMEKIENSDSIKAAEAITSIEGLDVVKDKPDWIKCFGISLDKISAVAKISFPNETIENIPEVIKNELNKIYNAGNCLGVEIMDFVKNNRKIKENEAIYFAWVKKEELVVLSFIFKN